MTKEEKIFYECKFCHNDYTLKEGFNLETDQCQGCDEYDIQKPIKDKERQVMQRFIAELGNCDFPYTPGDPYW